MAAPSPLFAVGRGVGQLLAEVRRLGGPRQGCSEPLLVALVARYSTPGPAGDPSARDISRDPSVVCLVETIPHHVTVAVPGCVPRAGAPMRGPSFGPGRRRGRPGQLPEPFAAFDLCRWGAPQPSLGVHPPGEARVRDPHAVPFRVWDSAGTANGRHPQGANARPGCSHHRSDVRALSPGVRSSRPSVPYRVLRLPLGAEVHHP